MKVLMYGADVKSAKLLSLDDRIIIVDEDDDNVLCNISENLYFMLKERAYLVDIHELKQTENNLYNIIARMTGLVR